MGASGISGGSSSLIFNVVVDKSSVANGAGEAEVNVASLETELEVSLGFISLGDNCARCSSCVPCSWCAQ